MFIPLSFHYFILFKKQIILRFYLWIKIYIANAGPVSMINILRM